MVLGWQVAPVYELQLVEASTSGGDASSSGSGGSGGSGGGSSGSSSGKNAKGSSSSSGGGSPTAAAASAGGGGEPDLLLPVLRDSRPAVGRANAVLGYAALLFSTLGAWLLLQQQPLLFGGV
jgi:hypothetical protein